MHGKYKMEIITEGNETLTNLTCKVLVIRKNAKPVIGEGCNIDMLFVEVDPSEYDIQWLDRTISGEHDFIIDTSTGVVDKLVQSGEDWSQLRRVGYAKIFYDRNNISRPLLQYLEHLSKQLNPLLG